MNNEKYVVLNKGFLMTMFEHKLIAQAYLKTSQYQHELEEKYQRRSNASLSEKDGQLLYYDMAAQRISEGSLKCTVTLLTNSEKENTLRDDYTELLSEKVASWESVYLVGDVLELKCLGCDVKFRVGSDKRLRAFDTQVQKEAMDKFAEKMAMILFEAPVLDNQFVMDRWEMQKASYSGFPME